MHRSICWLIAVSLGVSIQDANATQLLIAEYGRAPKRVAMFMEDHAMDAAGLGFAMDGPTRVFKVNMTLLYEDKDKPYWTNMDVTFECKNRFIDPESKETDVAETAKFQMLSGKTRAKNKVDHVPLSPTGWDTSTSAGMVQARNVACNMAQVRNAIFSSLKKDNRIDFNRLTREFDGLRIELVQPMPEAAIGFDFLADEAWSFLWKDTPMPHIDRGRPLTAEESKQMDEAMAQMKSRITNAQASVGNTMAQAKAERDFGETASAWRKGRKLSKIERTLLMAWQGQTPQELISKLGGAERVWQGPAQSEHFIYTNAFNGQNFVTTTQMVAPNLLVDSVVLAGIDKTCAVRFVAIPDTQKVKRVADVLVTLDHSGSGVAPTDKALCGGALYDK